MIYILLDTFIYTYTGYFITSYIFFLHYMNKKSFILSLILLFILNQDLLLPITFILFYVIDKLVFKYINYNLAFSLSMFTLFYIVIRDIDVSYFINIIMVIILYNIKYNKLGCLHEIKKISLKSNN